MGTIMTARDEGNAGLVHPNIWTSLRQIYGQMSPKLQHQLQMLLALMLFNAVAELGTIGAVLPLLALISHPESLGHYLPIGEVLGALGAATPRELLISTTVIFAAFATTGGILRLQLARSTFDFGYGLAHELTLAIQSRLLSQPYSFHIQRNTSTLISALDRANILVFDVGLPLNSSDERHDHLDLHRRDSRCRRSDIGIRRSDCILNDLYLSFKAHAGTTSRELRADLERYQ